LTKKLGRKPTDAEVDKTLEELKETNRKIGKGGLASRSSSISGTMVVDSSVVAPCPLI